MAECLAQGCTKDASTKGRGWCDRCYRAWLAYGDASLPVSARTMLSTHPPEAWDLRPPPKRNYEVSDMWVARYPGRDPMTIAQVMLRLLACGGCGHRQPFLQPTVPTVCGCGETKLWRRGKCRKCWWRAYKGRALFYDEIMPDEPCTLCGEADWKAA
jgi:hypothetical protein